MLGHVNNAAYWEAVEEELAARRDLRAPLRAEVEHRDGHRARRRRGARRRVDGDGALSVWLVADGVVAASAGAPLARRTSLSDRW